MTASASSVYWIGGLVAAVLYGISIGSFLNVVIYRLPRGESVSKPTWSYCPNCRHRLAAADLLPLFSFLMLGRKCRYCRQPISWRYFGVEALTGILFVLVYLHSGPTWDSFFGCAMVAVLIPVFFIDLEQFIIPDELSVLGFAIGVSGNIYGIVTHRPGMWMHVPKLSLDIPGALGSAVICAGLFHLLSFFGLLYYSRGSRNTAGAVARFWLGVVDDYAYLALKFLGFALWLPAARRFVEVRESESEAQQDDHALAPIHGGTGASARDLKSHSEIAAEIEEDEEQTGMGQGDAKLAAFIGANLLLPLSLLSFFLAVLAGTVVGVGLMVAQGRGSRTAIPFGPFMVVGAVVALLIGQPLLAWYTHYAFPAAR